MARRHHHNSVSLFPFLAVLVCAMGALILLLLVTTRKIRHDQQLEQLAVVTTNAAAITKSDPFAEIEDLKRQVREAEEAVASKLAQAEALQATVDGRRNQVESVQRELDDLRKRPIHDDTANIQASVVETLKDARQLSAKEAALLRQLNETEKQLLAKQQLLIKATDASKVAQVLLHEKHSALISLRTHVRNSQEKQKTVSGVATLLEFSNSTGTTRTPIVVDVAEKGFEVLPNSITISTADMEGFPVRDNPLLSAILTTHRYRSKNSVTDEPYILLLVRPDGCLAFYGAQRILIEAGIHYGYELLEPDRQIMAGEPDSSETPIVRAAMDEAFRRRENLYAKLMAIAQQGGEYPGSHAEAQSGSGERRMTMRPDGRIVVDEDKGRGTLDGRFYAGGVAPPAALLQNRPAGGYRGLDPDRLSPGDAEKLAEEFAERYSKQQEAARFAATTTAPPERMPQSGSSENPEADGLFRSSGERRFADAIFGSDGSLQSSRLAAATTPNPSFATHAAKPASTSVDSDGLRSSLQSGGAGSPASSTGQANSSYPGSPTESLLSAGEPGDGPSTGMPDLSRIDADLLRRLPSGNKQSGSMSTPVGIVVFLDEQHMTISQQPATAVSQESLDAAFATLLQGINTEVEDARRKPNEPLMPIVKFVVSPGGEKWRIPLAHSLKRMGIHTVAIFELTPYITSADRTGRASLDDERNP